MVFHLAALLSTRGERDPELAHQVNVEGTLNVLRMAHEPVVAPGRPVRFLFPSSIAVYGLPSLEEKHKVGRVREEQWNVPITMYGCNKLYCEHLGRYFTFHARQLGALSTAARLDFRALRFPGLISAETVPTGGTSDFGPEMIHAAAQGRALQVLRRARSEDPLHGDARRRARHDGPRARRPRAALVVRVQHPRLQRERRARSPSASSAPSRGEDRLRARSRARRTSSRPGPRTWTTRARAGRLGLEARVRLGPRLRRVPRSERQGPVCHALGGHARWPSRWCWPRAPCSLAAPPRSTSRCRRR